MSIPAGLPLTMQRSATRITFYWLEKAYSEKAESLQYVRVAKALDSFHSDPRYIDLLKRMGLPQ
jgi:hypothetical protein